VIVWLFGSTSPFAQALKAALESAGHSVVAYGRDTVDYNEPKEFVEGLLGPDMVIFNQHVGGGFMEPFLDYHPAFHRDYTMKPVYEHLDSVLLFKLYLIHYYSRAKFVFVTSSIAVLKEHGLDLVMYRMLRSLEHQIIYAAAADGINAIGICPGGLNSDNTPEYAGKTIELALSNAVPGKIYFANTGDEVPA
jgi:hypothetical protein